MPSWGIRGGWFGYAGFDNDGSIRELRYNLICQKDGGVVYYNVNLAKNQKAYIIRRSKMDQWLQYAQLVTAQRFFETASMLNINTLKPKQEYDWYSITSQDVLINYDIKDHEKYLIDYKGEITQVSNERLPVTGYLISIYGMHKMSDVSYEGQGYQDYLFDVIQDQKGGP